MQTFARFTAANSRWLAGGFFLAFFSSFGQTFFIALSGGEIRRAFDLTNGEFGSLYMVATLMSAGTLPFLGRLLDRFSVLTVSIGTMVMLAAATVAFGLAWSVPSLLAAIYMLRLFGQGMMTEVALTAIGRWFAANRGRAVAITTLGNWVGQAVYPLLFLLIAAHAGWRNTWLACAGVVLVVALPAISALVRVERDPRWEIAREAGPEMRDWTRWEVLGDPKFYVICAGALAPAFIGTTIFFHQAYLAQIKGWSLSTFGIGFMLMSAIAVGVGLVAGALIDRFLSRSAVAGQPRAPGALLLLGRLDRPGGGDLRLHGIDGRELRVLLNDLRSDLARALWHPSPRRDPLGGGLVDGARDRDGARHHRRPDRCGRGVPAAARRHGSLQPRRCRPHVAAGAAAFGPACLLRNISVRAGAHDRSSRGQRSLDCTRPTQKRAVVSISRRPAGIASPHLSQ